MRRSESFETVGDAARLIVTCPYDQPRLLPPSALKMARLLEKHGLLESNPWAPRVFRCTSRGQYLRKRLLTAGAAGFEPATGRVKTG